MALKLAVISAQRDALGAGASIVVGVGGGSIGRARDNDWILPDPQRYLSAHHARIQFRHGSYYLFDTSSNGVFVNNGTVPLGRLGGYPLRDGDILSMGEYQVVASIDAPPQEETEASSIFPVSAQVHAADQTAGHIGVDLSLGELLKPDASASQRLGPVGAFGQTPLTSDSGLMRFDHGNTRTSKTPEAVNTPNEDALALGGAPAALGGAMPAVVSGIPGVVPGVSQAANGDHRVKIPSAARREMRAAERTGPDTASAIESLCHAAGIDARQLPVDMHGRVLHLAGLLLREALAGVKDLALAQREIRANLHLEVDHRDRESEPMDLSGLPVEELLLRLVRGHALRELDAVQWLRDTLGGARRHDIATMRAMRSALAEFVARLHPQALSEHANGAVEGQVDPAARFKSITDMAPGSLPHLYVEAFARAFATEFDPAATDRLLA